MTYDYKLAVHILKIYVDNIILCSEVLEYKDNLFLLYLCLFCNNVTVFLGGIQ